MPLPTENTQWPPKASDEIFLTLAEWDAWWKGLADGLASYYGSTSPTAGTVNRPAQYRGGVVGAVARMWWGRPISLLPGERATQLHVPIAADLAQASSDLLYSERPSVTIGDDLKDSDGVVTGRNPTQERLDVLFDEDAHETLAAGAEIGAALGGRYHRVTWDRTVYKDRPFITTVDADAAWPEFRHGVLSAVTFWWVLERDGEIYYRHLERHELNAEGVGLVQHGLYLGSSRELGRAVSLTDHPSTAPLATAIDADGYVIEGRTEGLLVTYFPNVMPSRRWRSHPTGRNLGRSDFDGVEPWMDALDEAFTSWMRDLRLAKSRILIPEYMMRANGPGSGATFDYDREVFVPIRSAAPEDGDATITINQFTIRVEEHERTCAGLLEVILRRAGYSSQTFGEAGDGVAATATEITARERRSYLTSGRKKRVEGPRLERLLEKLLSIDFDVFGTRGIEVGRPQVVFGDAVQEAPLTLAQTALALDQARSSSTKVRVQLLHPDWDETSVDEEVALILEERGTAAPDPFGFTG